jgi:hypothetical protein
MPAVPLPEPVEVLRAVETYIHAAYPGGPPAVTRARVELVKGYDGPLFACREFVAEPRESGTRYTLRLGNPFYPHMKLAIEPSPAGDRYLYRADTHDRHICPKPESPEYAAFTALMEKNQSAAEAVEAAWGTAGIPTFRSYLREDLRRRQQAAMNAAPGA